MHRILFFIFLISNPLFAEGVTLYKNAKLIFPERSEVLIDGSLVVDDGRFAFIGEGASGYKQKEITKVIDLKGKFVSAGFIDTHAHISLGPVSYKTINETIVLQAENSLEIARWNGEKLLKAGITSIRNPGGDTAANIEYREAQEFGDIIGPRAFVAGSILNTEPFDGLVEMVNSEDEIKGAVDRQAMLGVDYIKLYTGLNKKQIKTAVRRAKQYEIPVIAHLEDVSWLQAVDLEIDSLVHAIPVSPDLLPLTERKAYKSLKGAGTISWYQWYQHMDLDSDLIQELTGKLVDHNIAVDPTLIVLYNTFFADQSDVTGAKKLQRVYPSNLKNWKDFYHFNIGWKKENYTSAQQTWPKVLQFVKKLHGNGVLLSVGTDLGNPWVIPGESFYQEMELFATAGISAMEILKLATVNGAKVLHQEDELGRLEKGLRADFIVFNSDPTEDIRNARDIYAVYQDGERVN